MRLFFIAIYSLLSTLAFAEIVETKHFCQVKDYVDEDTLLLLDIDDTLLAPQQMLGGDQWFRHRLEIHLEESMNFSHALELAVAEWVAVRHLTQMELVEPGTETILKGLQEKGLQVMGLTAQGCSLSHRTVEHLRHHQIDLSLTAPFNTPYYYEEKDQGILFRKGILFTSGTPKGKALFRLFDQYGYRPKKIVFVDDRESNLTDVEKEASKEGISFIGIRYGYADERKENFDPAVADIQLKNSNFHSILSDEEALLKKLDIFPEQ